MLSMLHMMLGKNNLTCGNGGKGVFRHRKGLLASLLEVLDQRQMVPDALCLRRHVSILPHCVFQQGEVFGLEESFGGTDWV